MIKKGEFYYLVSNDYLIIPPMSLVNVRFVGDLGLPYISDLQSGNHCYVEPHELLTLDQIIKLRDDHLEMMDAIERHG